ncbi:uncharacterized protein TNCV_5122761 [Trichonephila clavipes]|nr:uncharacterized protein TNCV_5122761 [Trichonephila clavipes]
MARLLENWSRLEVRAVIQFLWAENVSAFYIHSQIGDVNDEEAMGRQHEVKFSCSFQSGRQDFESSNMAGSDRPRSSTTVTLQYNPHMAPSDYFLFPRLKEHLSGKRFSSDSAVKTSTEILLKGQGPDSYQDGLSKLVLRSDKSLNRLDDYVDK